MNFSEYLIIIVSGIFVNNFVLSQFLGICPFLGVSKKIDTAVGMGLAVIFVMGVASLFTFIVQRYVLEPLHIEYLQTIAFILVIAAFVQIVEMVLKKFSPGLYGALGVYLPLITTNCAVLGVAIVNAGQPSYNVLSAFINGVFSGVGFMLAIVLLAGVRERIASADIPKSFRGFPITLAAAAIISMAFAAFAGMV
ncbi:MAG: RnfABCDGE type electron transport complex subunit A [Clostridiales bacterium]|jgi:electron transport complex protein RnfA|nr:RnfABCDGE type electron transport complex subunit A [Clostridiales bacterium]